ncbi:MAG: Flp pilus assembly protein CpaB [Actinobacteria bacterium]|nr:Flp pilus assembly protein CpaB [Actinomycetota bacterium]
MKTRVMVVGISVAVGLIAALGLATYVNGIKSQVAKGEELVAVVMAQSDVPVGVTAEDLINREVFVEKKIPRKYTVQNAVPSFKTIAKQVVAQPIAKGEQITTAKFREPTQIGFSYRVPVGKRAVSIAIDDVTGISKMLIPHDRVDVIVTLKDGADGKPITKVLLQDVEVLAVGKTVVRPGEDSKDEPADATGGVKIKMTESSEKLQARATATLAITPEDAEKLIFGAEEGKLWMALRPGPGAEKAVTTGQTISTVLK